MKYCFFNSVALVNTLIISGALLLIFLPLRADTPALYLGAELVLGTKLIAEHRCAACHQQKVGGNGDTI